MTEFVSEYEIYVGGKKDISKKVGVDSIVCYSAVNQIPKVTLRLSDSGDEKQNFTLLKKLPEIKVGAKLIIKAGFDEKKNKIFSGLICELNVGFDGNYYTEVVAYGVAIKLADGLITKLFNPKKIKTDSHVIKALLDGRKVTVTKENIADTGFEHPQFLIYQQTPWRAMMSRILANGLIFVPTPEGNKVVDLTKHSALNPKPQNIKIDLKTSGFIDCKFNQDISSQFKQIKGQAWDATKQAVWPEVTASAKGVDKGSTLKTTTFLPGTELLNVKQVQAISKDEIQKKANAELLYRELDRFQGKVTFYSTKERECKDIKLLDVLELAELGQHTGKYLVSGIQHSFTPEGWHITVDLGLHLNYTLLSEWVNLPLVPNLIGKVYKDQAKATDKNHVAVILPAIDAKKPVWAKLLSPFASNKEGIFFRPKKNDEVIVGFVGGDARYPVILGSTHNEKNPPPQPFKEKELKPGIYFDKQKLSLSFDLKTPALNLSGSEKATINISEKTGPELKKGESSLTIGDEVVIKSKGKSELTLAKDIKMKTDGKVEVKVAQKVEIT